MRKLSTTVAVYSDVAKAEQDWTALESTAVTDKLDLADAALVRHSDEQGVERLERHSHHGWGKGAVAGAVVGILFPPALLGSAVVGGVGGAVVARLNRSLDRGDIKDLGDVMDRGEIAIVAVTSEDTAAALEGLLVQATAIVTKASADADEVREALATDVKQAASTS